VSALWDEVEEEVEDKEDELEELLLELELPNEEFELLLELELPNDELDELNELNELDEDELLLDDSDDVLYFSKDDNEIDLKTLFRELILLEKQIKNICKETCKGLCSNCGTNLNEGNCKCSVEAHDNPWEVLKNLEGKA